MLRIPEILLGALLAVAIFAIGMTFSSLQPLTQTEHHATTEQHTPDKVGEHDNKTQSLWVPTDSVGLYTLVLAVFTGLLVGVSIFQGYFLLRADKTARIAADAAMLSARAAIGIELPVIRADRVPGLVNVSSPPTPEKPYSGGIYTQGVPGQYSVMPAIEFKNFGRTPAFPIRLMVGWKIAKELPSEPDYFHTVNTSATAIINPDGEFTATAGLVVEMPTEDREPLYKQTAFLWLYVSLHYRDILNSPHEARFCWRRQTSGFGTGGSPPSSYTDHS